MIDIEKFREINVGWDLVKETASKGKTLSQRLEELDPSSAYSGDLGKLDAYQRQLLKHNIFPFSDAKAGIQASRVEAFFQAPDSDLKSLFPEYIERSIREAKMQDSILPYLIATTTTITGNSYRSTYIDDSAVNQKKRRVPLGTPLPKVKFTPREQTNNIYKYGVALEAPYELTRWMSLDYFNLFIRREAAQSALDEAEDAIDALVDGDGNDDTAAAETDITDVRTGASADTLDYETWLIWVAKFRPYQLNTIVAGEAEMAEFLTMDFPNIDPLKVISFLKQDRATSINVQIAPNVYGDLTLVLTDHEDIAGQSKLLCLDRRFAVQRLVEAGSTISENGKYIDRQTEILTISENSGFSRIFADAAKILDYGN